MLGNRKLFVDTHSGISDYLKPWTDQEFWNLAQMEILSNAVYVVCRQTIVEHNALIRKLAESGALVALSVPEEGSETLLVMCLRWNFGDLVQQGRVVLIGGGDMHPRWTHIQHEFFMPKVYYVEDNWPAFDQMPEIFTRVNKPYKFLFLNGRQRNHRKYLIERFRLRGLLDQALWTCLDTGIELLTTLNIGSWFDLDPADYNHVHIQLMHQDQNLMSVPSKIRHLPVEYEADRYQQRVGLPTANTFVKTHLFNNEWGDAVINPRCYTDTYFSLVTETVFNYPYSFRTEKIWKPIAMGHPWIAVANSGFYRDLRNMGFQTFDGIIDESFDCIERSQDRIERIAQVVEDLCQQDLDQFLAQCYNICKYNQQHYFEMVKLYPEKFTDQLYQFLISHIHE
jgi:hypothetical protein